MKRVVENDPKEISRKHKLRQLERSLVDLAANLLRVCRGAGKPITVVSDNGTELTSMAVLKWCQETGVNWHYINPASRCRTGSLKASTAASGMNA